MAERDCPKTQMSMDKNEETMPTAARETVAFKGICPTMAASVSDKIGSETPAIMAGMASRLICLLLTLVFKVYGLKKLVKIEQIIFKFIIPIRS